MKILVVDDADLSLVLTSRVIESMGHEVVACQSGEQALNLLEQSQMPSIAVIDWMMPKMSGLDVMKRLRASTAPGQVFIVMLSARAEVEDREEALRAGANLYVSKPLRPHEIAQALQTAERALSEWSAESDEGPNFAKAN
jgi:CheY-like chemotaxis protein